MKTAPFVGYLLLCAGFVFLAVQEYQKEKAWNKFTVKKSIVVQEGEQTQNSPFFARNNRK